MELGINPTVDDISASYLDKIRNAVGIHLLEIGADQDPRLAAQIIDDVIRLVAEHMHDACSDSFRAGGYAATDVVPDVSILDSFDTVNPVIDAVEADLIDNGASTKANALELLPELESRLGELTGRERIAVLDRFDD